MDTQTAKPGNEQVEMTDEGHDGSLAKDLAASGELVTVDKGVPADEVITELPAKEQARILRKIDFRIVPLLSFLYLMAYIDRNNSTFALSCSAVWDDR